MSYSPGQVITVLCGDGEGGVGERQDFTIADTFVTPYADRATFQGARFELLRIIEQPDDTHDQEALPMFVIRFEDGTETEAFVEEVMTCRWGGYPKGRA